jgi:hypothetical protein
VAQAAVEDKDNLDEMDGVVIVRESHGHERISKHSKRR